MHDASHVRCSVCGVELDQASGSDAAVVHACEACAQNLRDISYHGRALVISAVRQRMQQSAPRLFATMQTLWQIATRPDHE